MVIINQDNGYFSESQLLITVVEWTLQELREMNKREFLYRAQLH